MVRRTWMVSAKYHFDHMNDGQLRELSDYINLLLNNKVGVSLDSCPQDLMRSIWFQWDCPKSAKIWETVIERAHLLILIEEQKDHMGLPLFIEMLSSSCPDDVDYFDVHPVKLDFLGPPIC